MGVSFAEFQQTKPASFEEFQQAGAGGEPPVRHRPGRSKFTAAQLERIANANVEPTPEELGEDDVSNVGPGMALRAFQGTTLGAGKHLIAALDALPDVLRGRGRGAYSRSLTDVQGLLDEADEAHPVYSALAELAGSVPTMFVGGGAGPAARVMNAVRQPMTAAQRAAKFGRLAGEGAAYGATGAGLEAARPGAEVEDVATHAAVGAGAGAVLAPAIGSVAEPIAARLAILRRAKQAGTTADVLLAREAEREAAAKNLFDIVRGEAGRMPDYSDPIKEVLAHPQYRSYVEKLMEEFGAPAYGTPDFLLTIMKRLNQEKIVPKVRAGNKGASAADELALRQMRDRAAEAGRMSDALSEAMAKEWWRPPMTMEVPLPRGEVTPGVGAASGTSARGAEKASLPREPRVVRPEREPLVGPEQVAGHAVDMTDEQRSLFNRLMATAAARKAQAEGKGAEYLDAMLRQVRELEPVDVPTPEFRTKGQGQEMTPGVEIGPADQVPSRLPGPEKGGKLTGLEPADGTPSTMRVETAPAERVGPYSRTYPAASQKYAEQSGLLAAVERGEAAVKATMGSKVGKGAKLARQGESGLLAWANDPKRKPDEILAAIEGVVSAVESGRADAPWATWASAMTGGASKHPGAAAVGALLGGGPPGAIMGELLGRKVGKASGEGIRAMEAAAKLLPVEYRALYVRLVRAMARAGTVTRQFGPDTGADSSDGS